MNVIFCTSPFQVLVAKEVIKKVDEEFYGVYLLMSEDIRQREYANRMKQFCSEVTIIDGTKITDDLKNIITKISISKLFVASMDNPVALALWNPQKTELYTFDDGSTSVITPNMYTSNIERLIHPFKFPFKYVLNAVKKHYTIFEESVLFPKDKLVKLKLHVQPSRFKRSTNGKTVKVFLGQALGNNFSEIDQKYTEELTEKAIFDCQATLFYPHPRVSVKVDAVQVIETSRCFEEEIYELLTHYEFVEVYGFYSTSLLLIQSIEGVKVQGYRTFLSTHETACLERLGISFKTLSLSSTLVSIVMPVFNVEETVAESIESVLNQTHENFELLIVDDGSIDRTKEVCRRYLKDSRVKYIQCEHGGISNSLNEGIRISKSEFIARQDGDDVWFPWHLDLVLSRLESTPSIDIVGAKVSVDYTALPYKLLIQPQYHLEGEELWKELAYNNCFNHSTVVFRKSAFEEAGQYASNCDGFEDWHLWARMVTKTNAYIWNATTIFYRLREDKKKSKVSQEGLQFRVRLAKSRGLKLEEVIGEINE